MGVGVVLEVARVLSRRRCQCYNLKDLDEVMATHAIGWRLLKATSTGERRWLGHILKYSFIYWATLKKNCHWVMGSWGHGVIGP